MTTYILYKIRILFLLKQSNISTKHNQYYMTLSVISLKISLSAIENNIISV